MDVCIITCHDVYNLGASLQAYAFMEYLASLGHPVRIIDYKPPYLSRHFNLLRVHNPVFSRTVFHRALYLAAKLPKRLYSLNKKKAFDRFTAHNLNLTKRYRSNDELLADPPQADVYFAGSDQIWNPLFDNGKDPAFFLAFVPGGKMKASYAASFGTDEIPVSDQERLIAWIRGLDAVSVREPSSLAFLRNHGIERAVSVLDPVFLHDASFWSQRAAPGKEVGRIRQPYVFLYDFEDNASTAKFARELAKRSGGRVVSYFRGRNAGADAYLPNLDPFRFLRVVMDACCVVTSSFHAVAFSILFKKEFYISQRRENLNVRVQDLLETLGIRDRQIREQSLQAFQSIDYSAVSEKLDAEICTSKQFIEKVLARP